MEPYQAPMDKNSISDKALKPAAGGIISLGMLKDVWAFRGFVISSVKREFHSRFVNARLGILWLVLQPLAMILIYTLIFSELMKPSLPGKASKFAYSIYLCSGLLTWSLFSNLLNRSIGIFVHNAHLLKKIHFPKLCLPLVAIFSSLVDFAIIMAIFVGFLLLTGEFPGVVIIGCVPPLAVLIALTVGLGVFLGVINVFYRDVEQTMGIVLQFWFWLTPIVYFDMSLPQIAKSFLAVNPIWPVINAMHRIFVEGAYPIWRTLIYPCVLSLIVVFLGMFSFWRLHGEIVDEL
ncbi:ABC transporter permease [Desulfosoma caldarium]|uniref:Transport permease protein n=1 Tax=Desulfosoma caldarium TaxID=610254 RepID=A0A3N1VJZ8_9BACT|nr:ABC transporter permease [Desulfosoma caldarium]ROR03143.1 lipopolysaccharide transport system permease protein [Desulfosoma caldarium]